MWQLLIAVQYAEITFVMRHEGETLAGLGANGVDRSICRTTRSSRRVMPTALESSIYLAALSLNLWPRASAFGELPQFVAGIRSAGNMTPIINSWGGDGTYWNPKNPKVTEYYVDNYASSFDKVYAYATAGGAADWFAVRALFHEVPLPFIRRHTNIIAAHPARIVLESKDKAVKVWSFRCPFAGVENPKFKFEGTFLSSGNPADGAG